MSTIKDYTNFLINNTSVTNYLRNAPYRMEDSVERNIGGSGRKVMVAIKLYDDLSAMDFAVLDAVASFYANQIYTFSVRELICYMNGCEAKSITAARVSKMKAMLEHLCDTRLSLHITDELRSRKLDISSLRKLRWFEDTGKHQYMKGPLLCFETLGTRKCIIQEPPLLYEYAHHINNQFQSVPPVLLKHIEGVSDTDRLFLTRYYLLHRLELLRYKQSQNASDSSSFQTIWYSRSSEQAGRDQGLMPQLMLSNTKDPNHQRRAVHQGVTTILDYFRKLGYIKDYEVITSRPKRGIVLGVKILGNVSKTADLSE